jgi:DEAD/DEAH box helicase domain-containing protein
MLSLIQADEIKSAVVEYLKATYNFDDKRIEQAFGDFLYNKRNGMFKGPYIHIRMPFEQVAEGINLEDVLAIRPAFQPYQHQYEAFKRLSTRNHSPEPVILTTGTGSGKTESFLFPLLDYCYQHIGKPGIKAIILYPMNALATDQARRLAKEIYNYQDKAGNFILRDKIRAGLFIGEGRDKGKNRPTRMEEEGIIEDRDTLVQSPPDILLTNFKMLDFSLMQARFNNLWKHNFVDIELLKFIVLDELHTYDGAKGSDVANLIRRLKLKLSLSDEQLVPVGTSATMSGGDTGKDELVTFFSRIFGIAVDKKAVIEESRKHPEIFFDESPEIPQIDVTGIGDCRFLESDDYDSYIGRQLSFWGCSSQQNELILQLKKNRWLLELVRLCEKGVVELEDTVRFWVSKCFPDGSVSTSDGFLLVQSLTGILSYAKELSGTRHFPFLYFQTSYWLRSLHRILRKLQPTPLFRWETDLNPNETLKSLPPYYCRDCGGTGWLGIKKEKNDYLENDLTRTRQFFIGDKQNKNLYFISNLEGREFRDVFADDYSYTGEALTGYLNPESLEITDKKLTEQSFRIFGVRSQDGDRIDKICPHCNSRNTLALIGTGLPTLESIVAAQLMASATDPASDHDRKLLAFTNGVQDAAHQAGFIENRNYRFGMRHAIQAVLKNLQHPISLTALYAEFERYWQQFLKQEANPADAYTYKFLPPDCESRIRIDEYREKDKSFKKVFINEFSHRVSWEIWSEFSYNAGIGRTLEKSGASAVEFNIDQLNEVYDQLQYWLKQESLGDRIDRDSFVKFLLGFLHRLRFKGGVDHNYLRKYRTERTNYWLITQNTNKKHFLIKNFGKNTRLPKFATLSHGPNSAAFEIIQTQHNKHNWYSTWMLKCFPMVHAQETELINEFYQQLLEYLEANRLLDKKVAAGVNNTGLNPDQIYLTTDVHSFECPVCGNALNVGSQNAAFVTGMPCLQHRCTGNYQPKENAYDYYRMVYNRGRALRIYAKDHTGLIDRDKREQLERDFKQRPNYHSTNVLVATSTLEMGIDIGDLNIAFNASIPPETSNYLQRVGRAGRSSGTSLIVNLAGRDEHDQYYFEDTMEMMQGEIRTPSCYLGAKDILRRHFMAFCFDRWASANPDANRIPHMIRLLGVESLPLQDTRFVFTKIAHYISKNKTALYTAFRSQYSDEESLIALHQIEMDLAANRPVELLESVHTMLKSEIDFYKNKRKDIDARLKTLPATGAETEALKMERKAVNGALHTIAKRNTIEHITNLGILPNYAFPETGVHINAQIITKTEDADGTKYRTEDFGEIVRPASSAITELAPGNIFYSQGYKLESQGLELLSADNYEIWRFCSNCDALMKDADVKPEHQTTCPKCRHNSWGSIANRKVMVKLEGVLSVNDKEASKINDHSDDRERKFYHKSVHLITDPTSSQGAKVLKRVPFGIEFYTAAEYIEVNTGMQEEGFWGNRQLLINERENPEVGFVVCKTCGKATERQLSQTELDRHQRAYHFNYCIHKSSEYQGSRDEVFEELYLYRKFHTEALKILLPVQDFRTSEKVSIFKAGLMLGLKNYFKGHPDHILIREYEEFNPESGRKEQFLIMYESIPGGTGYLSRLFNPEEFTALLTTAYDQIKHCTCKDEGKDGCYKCIYTYSNQYDREILSRSEAETLFRDIVEKSGEWNEAGSLTNLTYATNEEESELEERFVQLLQKTFPASDFKETTEYGLKKYQLTLRNDSKTVIYEIAPQNNGNTLRHVKYNTRPDFVFKCVSIVKKQVSIENKLIDSYISAGLDEVEAIKPIVVYLDGYQYHASAEHNRVANDLKIRNAILESGRYHCWIFSWDEINKEAALANEDQLQQKMAIDSLVKVASKLPLLTGFDFATVKKQSGFSRFCWVLSQPLETSGLKLWSAVQLFACQTKLLSKCIDDDQLNNFLQKGIKSGISFEAPSPALFAWCDKLSFMDELALVCTARLQDFSIQYGSLVQPPESGYNKDNWELFWKTYNLLQFHPVQQEDDFTGIPIGAVLENFRPELHSIVIQLLEHNIDFNTEYDFDLTEDEIILASAELGSVSAKFFLYPFDEESRKKLLQNGYKEYTIETFNLNI